MPQRLRVAAVFERGEKLFPKISKKPLALFCSWGIFLPVAGDDRDDDKRDFKLNESSLKNAGSLSSEKVKRLRRK